MKRSNRVASGLVLVLALAGVCRLQAQDAGDEGWAALIRGEDFDGWSFHLTKEGKGNDGTFTMMDGVLVCSGSPSGYMYTKKTYSKFTLQLEWAFNRPDSLTDDTNFRGNSGVLVHIGDKNALGVWPRSIEVQGKHTQAGLILPIPRNVKCERTYDKEALAKVLKPVGKWNAMKIEVNGGDMIISLNGTVISTVSDCELTEGPIGLQSEGAGTRWRNIRIREK